IHDVFFKVLLGFFERFFGESISYYDNTPISKLTPQWIYPHVREFLRPYHKRTYLTKYADQLEKNRWAEWVSNRIDDILISDQNHGCKLTVQIQHFGGNDSQFFQKGLDEKTSFSWRDSTIVCVLDCFYDPKNPISEQTAKLWQEKNDNEGVRQGHIFSDFERKVFWGSYGTMDLHDDRVHYYDSEEKYNRLLAIKKSIDPKGVFTPNAFCVGGSRPRAVTTTPALLFSMGPSNLITLERTEWDDQQELTNSMMYRKESLARANRLRF
ncbi:MAG: hypothetical protein ACR2HS_01760, partial [Gammaproteobacteria bacterium]